MIVCMAQVDRFSVTMPPDLGEGVRRAAQRQGISVSAWLSEAAADRLRNELLGAAWPLAYLRGRIRARRAALSRADRLAVSAATAMPEAATATVGEAYAMPEAATEIMCEAAAHAMSEAVAEIAVRAYIIRPVAPVIG